MGEKPSIAEAIAKGLCTVNGDRTFHKRALPIHSFTNPNFPKAPHAHKVRGASKQKQCNTATAKATLMRRNQSRPTIVFGMEHVKTRVIYIYAWFISFLTHARVVT